MYDEHRLAPPSHDERPDRKGGFIAPGETILNSVIISEIRNQIDISGTFRGAFRTGSTMRNTSTNSSTLSLSAALAASLFAACAVEPDAAPADELDGLDETSQEATTATTSVTPLSSFTNMPNIRTAIGALPSLSTTAVVQTVSGFQIYRCEQGATATEWKLRTPLAGFAAATNVQRPSLNCSRLSSLVGSYHYRSDFGGLLAAAQIEALGLAVPAATAPVWDFTFQPTGAPLHREALAGRLLAQDATDPANIPLLLLEVRGRSIDPGAPTAIASSTHVLRWNTRGGLAPAASTCTTATLGREVQSPYYANYYFLTPAQ
jgi:hypothetical protein